MDINTTKPQMASFTPEWSNFDEILKTKDWVLESLRGEIESIEPFRLEKLSLLREEFKSVTSKNLFVRGSFARGDFPCDDIDIFHYDKTSEFKPENWPKEGVTRPTTYDHIPKDNLEECFNVSICMSCASLDCVPVTTPDIEVENIISHTKSEIYSTRKYYYLLFRLLEEDWNNNLRINLSGDYDTIKRYPGSKRTVQRIFWILQAIIPEYQNIVSLKPLLFQAFKDGILPIEVYLSTMSVMKAIKDSTVFSKDNYLRVSQITYKWFHSLFRPYIWNLISENIPPIYLRQITLAQDIKTDSSILSSIVENIKEDPPSYTDWLLSSVLSGNSSCSQNDLYSLWNRYVGKISYRCVLQNLLYNKSFPPNRVQESDVEYDVMLLRYFKRITKTCC